DRDMAASGKYQDVLFSGAGAGVDRVLLERIGGHRDGVVASAAGNAVVSVAAIDAVVARAARETVVLRATGNAVVAAAAVDRVRAHGADQAVAGDHVGPRDDVVSVVADDTRRGGDEMQVDAEVHRARRQFVFLDAGHIRHHEDFIHGGGEPHRIGAAGI